MTATPFRTLARTLSGMIPENRLITDPLYTIAYGTDAGLYRKVPGLIVKVASESELQRVMALCHDAELAFTFRGSGTSVSGQAISDSVLIMFTRDWQAVEVSDNGRRVVTSVGNTGGRINEILAPFGRKLGPDPASLKSATIGGMVANNSSGMTCGVAHNSQKTLRSMRMILADGTLLDTADPFSRAAFAEKRPDIIDGLNHLSGKIRQTPDVLEKIQKKYAIKNTTGFSVNALVDHDDPIDMLFHLMVGSEGCLGFISQVEFETVEDPTQKATAMMVFEDLATACKSLLLIKECRVDAAELMDRATIRAIEDLPGIPDMITGLGPKAAAMLVETRANDHETLVSQVNEITLALGSIDLVSPVEFYYDPGACRRLWEIRDGFDPIICAKGAPGTIMISEDIALNIEDLAPAIDDFHHLFDRHGYDDAVIFGHALAGNLHFVLLQDFNDKKEVNRYEAFIRDLVHIVVDKYNGSLKAEHGTGRNMAPFVRLEWGDEIYGIMKEIKTLLDPKGLLNPGVILNENPLAHVSDLKTFLPVDPMIDKCIECGFCERFCVSHNLTLSARQRIVIFRVIEQLEQTGADPALLARMKKGYDYNVLDTCAADGLCSLACPSGINTGLFVKKLRAEKAGLLVRQSARILGNHMDMATSAGRLGLSGIDLVRNGLGNKAIHRTARGMRKLSGDSIPKYFSHFPLARKANTPTCKPESVNTVRLQAVYFPSCINRTLGADNQTPGDRDMIRLTEQLCARAGIELIYPYDLDRLCCGLSFASKGLEEESADREKQLSRALMDASQGGRLPILCDMSPCLYHMKETQPAALHLYEPVEFALKFMVPGLNISKTKETVLVHPVCSLKKMGLEAQLMELAGICTDHVITTRTNCCGFAGDKGFTRPELNEHGLVDLKSQIPEGITQGYSTSRTCEIGLAEESGIPFKSILYLVEKCSRGLWPSVSRFPQGVC